MAGSARSYALRLLKSRLRSAWEIDQALLRRGVESDERETLIRELTEVDLINDERYALAWIHTRDRLNPRGDWLLIQELRKKGIDQATIQSALRQRSQETDELTTRDERLQDLVEKLQRKYQGLAPEVRRRRVLAYLARRGFALDLAERILNA